jgi:hypothetical protein
MQNPAFAHDNRILNHKVLYSVLGILILVLMWGSVSLWKFQQQQVSMNDCLAPDASISCVSSDQLANLVSQSKKTVKVFFNSEASESDIGSLKESVQTQSWSNSINYSPDAETQANMPVLIIILRNSWQKPIAISYIKSKTDPLTVEAIR